MLPEIGMLRALCGVLQLILRNDTKFTGKYLNSSSIGLLLYILMYLYINSLYYETFEIIYKYFL